MLESDRKALADEILRQMIFHGDPAIGTALHARHPELARFDFCTAVACGELDVVREHLARDASLANRQGGPLGWEPLLYLTYSRLPGHAEHAVQIASELLDRGADPNALWKDEWGSLFTVLTGVVGEGEGVKPPHPRADELVALLLERGANPFDGQLLYNNSIVGDDTHWLELLWNASAARGVTEQWRALPPLTPEGKQPPRQLDYLLGNAVTHHNPQRAAWLLAHGADPDCMHVYTGRRLLEVAQLQGTAEIVALLRGHGAANRPLSAAVAFQIACRQGDYEKARAIAAASPEVITEPQVLHIAAAWFKRHECAALLAPHSRDVHNMVSLGLRERLMELFAADPALVNQPHFRLGSTPLFWLPEDESKALEMARLLLAHGASVAARNSEGRTAAEQATLRGAEQLARLLATK